MKTGEDWAGSIQVICGPVFSGKTEELMRRLRRARIARRRTRVFVPAASPSGCASEILSHDGFRMKAQSIRDASEIRLAAMSPGDVIGIDDANFFGEELADVIAEIAARGAEVIVAGIDTDYRGRPFPPLPALLANAELVTKLLAVCAQCGNSAKETQRLDTGDHAEGQSSFEPRCRKCFVSFRDGRP